MHSHDSLELPFLTTTTSSADKESGTRGEPQASWDMGEN
jgi:hypothetical protein